MRLSEFITTQLEPIMVEWEAFARSMVPSTETMSVKALRDHGAEILLAIAKDIDSHQSDRSRDEKSKGNAPVEAEETSASTHGVMRQLVGFDLNQLGAEFRALRATVLRLWLTPDMPVDAEVLRQVNRFNEGIDQALAESIDGYSQHVSASRDTFLAVLGHDLRSPLRALSGCLDVLSRGEGTAVDPANARRQRALQIARRSIASIHSMVTDLLDYTRTRLGKGIEVVATPGDFGATCRECFDEVSASHPGRALYFSAEGDLHATFDAERLRQVVVNLLANAVQYGTPLTPIRLDLSGDAASVTAVVVNHGAPIPADALQVIFNPLVQVLREDTQSPAPPAGSLGLGLYIASEIVNRHDGKITVVSSAEDGTAFTVRLPRRGPQQAA